MLENEGNQNVVQCKQISKNVYTCTYNIYHVIISCLSQIQIIVDVNILSILHVIQ